MAASSCDRQHHAGRLLSFLGTGAAAMAAKPLSALPAAQGVAMRPAAPLFRAREGVPGMCW